MWGKTTAIIGLASAIAASNSYAQNCDSALASYSRKDRGVETTTIQGRKTFVDADSFSVCPFSRNMQISFVSIPHAVLEQVYKRMDDDVQRMDGNENTVVIQRESGFVLAISRTSENDYELIMTAKASAWPYSPTGGGLRLLTRDGQRETPLGALSLQYTMFDDIDIGLRLCNRLPRAIHRNHLDDIFTSAAQEELCSTARTLRNRFAR